MDYRYVIEELRHHDHRTLVNVLGIGLGIALFVSINAISAAYKEAVSLPFINLGADLVVQRPEKRTIESAQAPTFMRGVRLPFSNQLLSSEDLERLRTLDGVASVATSLLLWDFEKGGFRTIMGVDLQHPGLGPSRVKEWIKEGRFPQREGEVALEKHFAKFRQVRLGDSFEIGGGIFTVVGLVEIKEGSQITAANIYVPLMVAQSLLQGDIKGVNIAYLRLKNPSELPQIKKHISRELKGVSVSSSDSFLELMGGVSRISDQFSVLASLIALGGAVILVIKSMLSNLVERSREIGILKAVGWMEKDVQKQLMGEVLLQSLLGSMVGIFLGYVISYCVGFLSIPVSIPWELNLLPAFAKDAEASRQVIRLPVNVSAGLTAISVILSLSSGVVAGFAVGRRTARMKPVDILREL